MSGSIFISYRRQDTQHAAARLSDRLGSEFSNRVFFDVETLPAGVDFVEEVIKRIDACDAFLVMIGKSWLDIEDAEGGRRLDNPDDHVRTEIVRALNANKRIFPVLVDGAVMPARKHLPDELKPLAHRHARKLQHESFRSDCDQLVALLKAALSDAEREQASARKAAEEAELAAKQEGDRQRLQRAEEEKRQQREAEQRRRDADDRRRAEPEPKALAEAEPKAGPAASNSVEPAGDGLGPKNRADGSEPGRDADQGIPLGRLSPDRGRPHRPGQWGTDSPRNPSRRFVLGGGIAAAVVSVGGLWVSGILSPPRRLDTRLVLQGHSDVIRNAGFDPSGQLISTASADGTARIWLARDGKSKVLEGHSASVARALIAPNEPKIVVLTASDDNTARLWSFLPDFEQKMVLEHSGPVRAAAWSPDGQTALTAAGSNPQLWNRAGKRVTEFKSSHGPSSQIGFAAFSGDGRFFVTGAWDGTVNIWAPGHTEPVMALAGPRRSARFADFSPDGEALVVGFEDGTVFQWRNWKLGPVAEPMVKGTDSMLMTVRYSPDGKSIVTASRDGTAVIYDAVMGSADHVLEVNTTSVDSAQFSPDGRLVATASTDGVARLWDAATGTQLALLRGHANYLFGVAFSPDGKQVLTWSADKTARLWDVPGDLFA